MIVTYIGYDEIYKTVTDMAAKHDLGQYQEFVGVHRAGMILACMFGTLLNRPVSYFLKGAVYPEIESGSCLVVDDVLRTGKSLGEVLKIIPSANSLVLFTNDTASVDYFAEKATDEKWFLFPWDLKDFVDGNKEGYSLHRK